MSIKGVDLQAVIPKTYEISREQQAGKHQLDLRQQQIAVANQHAAEKKQQQVQFTSPTEQGKIRDKERERREGNKGNKREKEEDQKSEEKKDDILTGSHIDIKI